MKEILEERCNHCGGRLVFDYDWPGKDPIYYTCMNCGRDKEIRKITGWYPRETFFEGKGRQIGARGKNHG